MKANVLEDAQKIARELEAGTATHRDLGMLLMYVRERLPNDMVRDIAHSVAHTSRNKGHAFQHTTRVVGRLLDMLDRGGDIRITPIYPWKQMVSLFCAGLKAQGVSLDKAQIVDSPIVRSTFEELLDGIEIQIADKRLFGARFHRGVTEGRSVPDLTLVVLPSATFRPRALGPVPNLAGFALPVF